MRSARGVSPSHSMFDMAFLYLEAAISIIKCLGKTPLAERMTETFVFAKPLFLPSWLPVRGSSAGCLRGNCGVGTPQQRAPQQRTAQVTTKNPASYPAYGTELCDMSIYIDAYMSCNVLSQGVLKVSPFPFL